MVALIRESISLNQKIEEFLLERGAIKVGFATIETLAGSPPSADIRYKLDNARSAISFALPLNRDHIRSFLAKQDRLSSEQDIITVNLRLRDLSWELAGMIKEEGYDARGTSTNLKYRTETENWKMTVPPDISHRYMAVASGVGSFGWSGNVGMEGYGCTIEFGTTLTAAELVPTEPIPEGAGFCDNCKMCVSACPVEMFDRTESMSFELGGRTYSYAKRISLVRCFICCGGYSGLDKSGTWSTWSPGRFTIPDDEQASVALLRKATDLSLNWPERPGGYFSPVARRFSEEADCTEGLRTYLTCGNCRLVCWGDKQERAENLKLLRNSGCVVQRPDGTFEAVPSDAAETAFRKLDPETQALYSMA